MKRLITVLAFLGFGALALPACGGDNIHSAQVVTTANGDTVEIWCDGNTFHSKPVRQSVEYATTSEVTEPNSPYCKSGRVANAAPEIGEPMTIVNEWPRTVTPLPDSCQLVTRQGGDYLRSRWENAAQQPCTPCVEHAQEVPETGCAKVVVP